MCCLFWLCLWYCLVVFLLWCCFLGFWFDWFCLMMFLMIVFYILFIIFLVVCILFDGGDVILVFFCFYVMLLVLWCWMLVELIWGFISRVLVMCYWLEYVGFDFGIKLMLLFWEIVGFFLFCFLEKWVVGCFFGNIFDVYLLFRVSGWM